VLRLSIDLLNKMPVNAGYKIWLGVTLAAIVLAAQAANRPPDRRAVRPSTPASAPTRETLVDLLVQLEALQTEIRQLRGQLEVQAYELERLKNRQRDLLGDLDRRLRALERRGGGAPPGSAGSAPAPAASAGRRPAPRMPAGTAQEQKDYDAAFNLLKQGFYDRAAKSFRDFIAKHPRSSLVDNAQYWVGEANYVVRNFRLALEEFSKVVNEYPNSLKIPDAMLKIGYSHYELGAWSKAREILQQVIARYPNTTVSKSAEIRLAKMKKEGR